MSTKKNATHWAMPAQLWASDPGSWADSLFVTGDGGWLECLQTLDKQVTEQRKSLLYEFLRYYPPVWFMCIHVHIFWKNYYVIIYGYMYYKNLTTGTVGWGSSICLLMSCTFNTQICSIKFLNCVVMKTGRRNMIFPFTKNDI